LFLHRSPPPPLGSSSGRWFESCSCKPVRGAFPHQPYSYAKPSNQTGIAVLLMTQSKQQLQPELDLPWSVRRPRDHSELSRTQHRIRKPELRVVEQIERLGAKLHRQPLDRLEGFEQRKINIRSARPADIRQRAARVAVSERCGLREHRRVEVPAEPAF